MKIFRFDVFLVAGVVAVAGLGSGVVVASGATAVIEAYPMSDWRVETAVSNWNVGPHLSAGTDTATGETFISFYDRIEGDLYLARTGGPGPGNCGPGISWTCHLLDSEGDVGQYNSIAVDSGGLNIGFWISYFDSTHAALKVVEGYVSRATGELIVAVDVTVDSGNPGTGLYKGKHTDVAVDSLGLPRIAYQYSNDQAAVDEAQLYARWVGTGGNCGEGSVTGQWQCDLVYNAEGVGEYGAIDLDVFDNPNIAFYDRSAGYPVVATYVGSGGNCGLLTSWLCRDVRNLSFDTGRYLSLYVADGGTPHLAYYNLDHEKLEYAYYAGPSNGSCGPDYGWKCIEIDPMGSSLTPMGIAIEEDANGYPVIAFQDASEPIGPAKLVIARPAEAADWDTPLNCGPMGSVFPTWYCEAADIGGATISEADAVALTVNQQGEVLVAYRELDSYPFPPKGSLKVAYEPGLVFGDDFELGDTSAWSASAP